MIDVAERLAKEYYSDDTMERVDAIREMLHVPGIHFYCSPDNVLWVYMLLSDEGLDLLRSKKKIADFTKNFSEELLQHPGNHIYIFRSLAPENISQRAAFRRAAQFIIQKHNAVDISWHDDHRVFMNTYGGE